MVASGPWKWTKTWLERAHLFGRGQKVEKRGGRTTKRKRGRVTRAGGVIIPSTCRSVDEADAHVFTHHYAHVRADDAKRKWPRARETAAKKREATKAIKRSPD